MTPDDIRAAVAAGILTEAQAASVEALAHDRAGKRAALPAEDEPFEFFRGFSEIFVSIGLIILLSGIAALLGWFGGVALLSILPLICAGICWWWAGYFTLKRRMNLPSMVLATAFGGGIYLSAITILGQGNVNLRGTVVTAFVLAALGMAAWYRRFRLPFSAFILGLFALGAIYTLTASVDSLGGFISGNRNGMAGFFDLRESPQFATATLVFGIVAFLAGMWFDTRDPHRLGRHSATAFWLHMLAAPALVNTVALTLYNTGGAGGIGLLAIALVVITLLALVIDRRSFLTAAIAYIALVIGWVMGDSSDFGSWTFILIALGGLITAIGTWWVPLRAAVMRILPDFPGKSRLPPYGSTE
ncbi:MAG: hypothetical protein U1E06_01995 [Tabrizicola sp.]|uniref:hypothetical protein n=1 Tax=Tabrizicola sp. TaxID=2005166 RepID=UPI00273288EE|nr:hypothetical protein [Tabrizicola sp.]MDP3261658.1 hypothetical protein [Tabrizicola sp.]MDP3648272.1 hypothetical protein [Paracoccaceae bacterium]MDZ4065617.1 hypothetical protein [Tabrizicola sp.]